MIKMSKELLKQGLEKIRFNRNKKRKETGFKLIPVNALVAVKVKNTSTTKK